MFASIPAVNRAIVACECCPRLRAYCRRVAREKKREFRDDTYWGRPVPGFGDPDARLLIVGLAPAAHGANRTGRVFTGDRSGDFLFASLFRTGYANQPSSTDCFDTAAVKCAPPQNKPTPAERDTCRPYLERELTALVDTRVIVTLGQFGWDAIAAHFRLRPKPKFGHGSEVELPDD